jgi:hypothetical protein
LAEEKGRGTSDVGVFIPKDNALGHIFGQTRKVIVGVIHSRALPGSSRYRGESMEEVYEFAIEEGLRYREGGVQGLIVENHWDLPFSKPEDVGLETAAAMSVMAARVRAEVGLPVGVNVLANAAECSLAVAKASGADFIRSNQWVNAYVANEGLVEGAAAKAARYRAMLRADEEVRRIFGATPRLILKVVADPEAQEDRELFLLIRTDLQPKEARALLKRLRREWWLDAMLDAKGEMGIGLEYAGQPLS